MSTIIFSSCSKKSPIQPTQFKANQPQKKPTQTKPFIHKKPLLINLCRWPTDNTAFERNEPLASYIQPTCSGNPISGTYGCVRDNGTRFHEGIDIKSIYRGRHNLPQDQIFACLPGSVAYINDNPGASSYGKYIILEHTEQNLHFYSLYAHLAKITQTLKIGQKVQQSTILGQMGHSSCSPIPIARAHLHFEIGLRLGSFQTFQSWYDLQKFSTKNHHGMWNGLNLVGLDPMKFLHQKTSFTTFLKKQPIAFILDIYGTKTPEFIHQNSALVSKLRSSTKPQGWRISFNWVGAPIHFEPIFTPSSQKISLHFCDHHELFHLGNRHTLEFDKKGNPYLGKTLQRQLFCLWGETFPIHFPSYSNQIKRSTNPAEISHVDPIKKVQ